MKPKKLLIRVVDDDANLRQSLKFLLEAEGWEVETYESAEAFITGDSPSVPGCIILDVRMERMSGLELQKLLNERGNLLPIVFLTGHGDMEMAVNGMKNGAIDFVAKPIDPEKFIAAITRTIEKQHLRNLGIASEGELRARYALLTAREKEICRFLARGLLNRETAARLSISERTVEGHRASAFKKLQIKTVSELALILTELRVTS